MAHWRIEACTVDDAASVARNTAGAFWEAPMWTLQWPSDITQDFLIEQMVKRQPIRLLRERDTIRHQKAVDPESGRLVGYARWRLPAERAFTPAGEPEWAEAQMPNVTTERRKELDAVAAGAWWAPRTDIDELDTDNETVTRRVVAGRPYIDLELVAVHPENKGKGIATSLVESGIRQAKKMELPILVISYKAARGVYRQLGFIEVDHIIKDDSAYGGRGEYGFYFMLYEVPKTDRERVGS